MDVDRPDLANLIRLAQAGDTDALGRLLDLHRAYLKVMTFRQLDTAVGGRLDASDIVQQTCLSVFAKMQEFVGTDHAEFLAWLRKIHQRNIQNVIRDHAQAKKRSVSRERSLQDDLFERSELAADQSSPSQRMMQGEQAVELAAALEMLPDDQREAVRLRYLEGRSLAEIADSMQRTRFSVAGLVKRGLVRLRRELHVTPGPGAADEAEDEAGDDESRDQRVEEC